MDHLCFSVLCLLSLFVRLFICAFVWSPANILGQVWYLIVSIPGPGITMPP